MKRIVLGTAAVGLGAYLSGCGLEADHSGQPPTHEEHHTAFTLHAEEPVEFQTTVEQCPSADPNKPAYASVARVNDENDREAPYDLTAWCESFTESGKATCHSKFEVPEGVEVIDGEVWKDVVQFSHGLCATSYHYTTTVENGRSNGSLTDDIDDLTSNGTQDFEPYSEFEFNGLTVDPISNTEYFTQVLRMPSELADKIEGGIDGINYTLTELSVNDRIYSRDIGPVVRVGANAGVADDGITTFRVTGGIASDGNTTDNQWDKWRGDFEFNADGKDYFVTDTTEIFVE